MWPRRRQARGSVAKCCAVSALPSTVSHSRNSALKRPSGSFVACPTTSASAPTARQSANLGAVSRSEICSMKAARSSGRNNPDRSRSAWTTSETACASRGSSPMNAGIAIGRGRRLASSIVTRVCAQAGPIAPGTGSIAAPNAPPPRLRNRRRLTPPITFDLSPSAISFAHL